MMPNAMGQFPEESSEALATDSKRKRVKSISRLTRRSMKDSLWSTTLHSRFGPAKMEFKLTSPPAVEPSRLSELARLQVSAFMYWLTFHKSDQRGLFVAGEFYTANIAIRNDWGNPLQRSFMETVRAWDDRLVGGTAGGHFGVAIRRRGDEALWSWALEWNMNYRMVGLMGSRDEIRSVVYELPVLEMREVSRSESEVVRMRRETPLEPSDDKLFA